MMGLISDGKVNRQSHDGEYSVSEESGRPLNRFVGLLTTDVVRV